MMPSTPIADFVRRYSSSGTARLHMPGHKGVSFLGCEPLDLTEIAGADELYEAEGIIAESEANAAQLFGTAATYYSAGGSSQCIRAMLLLAMQAVPAGEGRPVLLAARNAHKALVYSAATYYSAGGSSQCIRAMLLLAMQAVPAGEGRPVLLAARNAHKALVYSAALLDFEIQWLWPQGQGGSLCSCPVTPASLRTRLEQLLRQGVRPFGVYLTSPDYLGYMQDVQGLAEVCQSLVTPASLRTRLEQLLRQGVRPFGVYLTSPDYLGYMQDVQGLAEVCQSLRVPLLVDNAHGAGRGLPESVRAAAGGQRTRRLSALFAGGQPAPDRTGGCYVLRLRS